MEQYGISQEREGFNETANRIVEGISWAHVTSNEEGRNALAKAASVIEANPESDLFALYIQGTLETNTDNNPDVTPENVLAVRKKLVEQHEQDEANKAQLEEAIAVFKNDHHD